MNYFRKTNQVKAIGLLIFMAVNMILFAQDNGLSKYNFLYAGESPTQNIYIIKNGQIAWEYKGPRDQGYLGEVSDAVLMTNGNILFAHQRGITLMSPHKKVLWHYDTPEACETHSAQPIGTKYLVFLQNGDPAQVNVVDIKKDKIVHSFNLQVKDPKNKHAHFRHARLTKHNTILVAHMDLGKVAEYDFNGKEVFSYAAPGIWAAEPTENDDILICGKDLGAIEINRNKEVLWKMTPEEFTEIGLMWPVVASRRPNGNTIITGWQNTFNGPEVDRSNPPLQAIEVNSKKEVLWKLNAWNEPVDLGPATIIQLLEDKGISEKIRFGKFK